MTLRFLGRETGGGGCPTLYETDHGTFVIQGWGVADPAVLAVLGKSLPTKRSSKFRSDLCDICRRMHR